MPILRNSSTVEIWRGIKAFLNLETGLTRGRVPELVRSDRLHAQTSKLQQTQQRLRQARQQLENKDRQIAQLRKQLRLAPITPNRWIGTVYIVSDKHRFVFLGTHKVATTSILTSLLPFFEFDVEGKNFDDLKRGPTFKHNDASIGGVHKLFVESPYQINKTHFLAGIGNEYHRYFKFAFVRNPWDRLVSCYWSKVRSEPRMRMGKYGDVSLHSDMSFKEFAEAVCRIPDEVSNTHFRSQHVTICDDGLEKNVLADFVGRFENLEEDFGFVAEKIGLNKSDLTHYAEGNYSKIRPYRDSYDEKLARMVGERYREDANLFDYAF